MRVRKLREPDRSTPGRATGVLICNLALPAIEESFVIRFFALNPDRTMASVRRFILKKLPKSGIGLEGAIFAISAEVRRPSRGVGRKQLARWRSGDQIQRALERAASEWARLPKEEWPGEAVEIDL